MGSGGRELSYDKMLDMYDDYIKDLADAERYEMEEREAEAARIEQLKMSIKAESTSKAGAASAAKRKAEAEQRRQRWRAEAKVLKKMFPAMGHEELVAKISNADPEVSEEPDSGMPGPRAVSRAIRNLNA